MFRRAAIGLILATGIGTAEAATVSQIFDFGAESFDGSPAVQSAFVEAFDPALGELESIALSVDIETEFSGTAFNRTGDLAVALFLEQFDITLDGAPVFDDVGFFVVCD